MDAEFALPFFVKTTWVIGIFIGSLVLLDLILVRWLKLGKLAWKRIDYVWLGVGAIGLVVAVEAPRNNVIDNILPLAESRLIGALERLNSAAEYGRGLGVCRIFIRSQYSPPQSVLQKLQKDYDAVCAWFKTVAPLLPQKPEDIQQPIEMNKLPSFPGVSDPALRESFEDFTRSVIRVNQHLARINELRATKKRGAFEDTLQLLGPVLLAIAIALRITKVTGEIKNEALDKRDLMIRAKKGRKS